MKNNIGMISKKLVAFLAILRATGAIIKTVATLSTKAETIAEKSDKSIVIHLVLLDILIIESDNLLGILESINKLTVPIIPSIINNTL